MKALKKIEGKIFASLMCEAFEWANEMKKGEQVALGVGAGAMVAAPAITGVFAAERFDQALGKMLEKIYLYMLGISTGLAVVLAGWNIIKYMAATDPQSALMAKKSAIRVAIAWIILNSLGGIATLLSGLATGGKYTGKWSE